MGRRFRVIFRQGPIGIDEGACAQTGREKKTQQDACQHSNHVGNSRLCNYGA